MDSLKVQDTSFFQTKTKITWHDHEMTTPPKFNIELEHKSLEQERPFGIFSGSILNFRGIHI